jgi:predicted DNA repair protein MutK
MTFLYFREVPMAGSSLFLLIDDIATILDDISLMTKAATKKTAGVLGDDLALNAQQVSGVKPSRELPVVWAVAKGSLLNKAILVPAAVAVSFFAPWLVTPLLMLGGAFLCYEGAEKLVHRFLHKAEHDQHKKNLKEALKNPQVDLKQVEKDKIKGAIRTDFILSAEIIAITLGTVTQQPIGIQFAVLSVVALMVTVCVYGLVAGIVKLDDGGLYLTKKDSALAQRLGHGILWFAPYMMKTLSVLGTIAMFLVGGGILTHGFSAIGHGIESFAEGLGDMAGAVAPIVANGVFGLIAGLLLVAVLTPLLKRFKKPEAQQD